MSEWRTIDTAPKDGTPVLTWHKPIYGNDDITVMFFDDDYGWCLAQTGSYAEDSQPRDNPTHWMPLPKPPEEV